MKVKSVINPILFATLASLTSLSLADVKAVVKVDVTGGPRMSGGAGEHKVTVFESGGNLHIEREGQVRWLLVKEGQKFLIDDQAKTYALIPSKSREQGKSPTSTLKLTKKTDTKSIFDMTANRYDLSGKVTVQPSGGGGRGAGRRFGGSKAISLSVDGTFWTAPDIKGFGLGDLVGERGQAFGGLGDQLSDAGLILEGNMSINLPPMARGRMDSPKISFVTESLSRSPLDASLFGIPVGYVKADAPIRAG